MADGRVVIEVELDDKGAVKGVKGLEKTIDGVSDASEKATVSLGKIVSALGLVQIAGKVFDLIRDSISKAFSRIDTMEQFERVMTTMTGSTEEANAALEVTNEIVTGTAYGLDVAAKAVQNFVTRGLEVDKATDSVEAWGDAVAFYGDGSNETFTTVTSALSTMVTKGNVDMEQMNRLFDAGIPALDIYADAVGKSTDEVAEQISAGELKAEDFIDVMNTAFKSGTDGFASISGAAKDAGATWGATFDNMAAAVARGVTSIIEEIDRMLEENGLPTMREIIKEFGSAMEDALNGIAEAIPIVVDLLKDFYDWCSDVLEIVEVLSPAIYGLAAAFASFYIIINFIGWMESAYLGILYLKDAVMVAIGAIKGLFGLLLAHPIALIVAAVIGLVVAIVTLWNKNEEFRSAVSNIWNHIKKAISTAIEVITIALSSFADWMSTTFSGLISWFASLGPVFQSLFNGIVDGSKEISSSIADSFGSIVEWTKNAVESVGELWDSFKESAFIQGLLAALGGVLEFTKDRVIGFKDAIVALVRDFDLQPLLEQAVLLIPKLVAILLSPKLGLVLAGANLISNIAEGMGMTVPELFEKITNALVGIIEQFAAALPGYVEMGTNVITSLIEGITMAIPLVIEVVVSIILTLVETLVGVLPVIVEIGIQLLTSLIEGIVAILPVFIETAIQVIFSFIGAIVGALPLVIAAGVQLLLVLLEGIISVLPTLLEAAIMIVILLVQQILTLLPMLIEVGVNLIISLVQGIIQMVPMLIEAGIQLLMALVTSLIELTPVIIETGVTLVTSLANALISMVPEIIDAGIKLLMALIGGLVEVLPALIEMGIQLVIALGKALISMIPVIINAGIQILLALIKGIISMIPQLLSAGWQLVRGLVGAIVQLAPQLLSAGVKLIQSLVNGITSTIGGVSRAVSSGITSAINTVTGFLGRFRTAGSNIVGNIADGIRGAIGKVTSAISSVTQKIRDFLPFSPPKDKRSPLADIHKNGIGEQISKGIYDGENEVKMAMDHILQVPDVKQFMPDIGRSLSLEAVGTSNSQMITNDNGVIITIENIENHSDSDIPRILEESAWILDRERGRLDS